MAGRRVKIGMIALLLLGTTLAAGWRLYRPERLLRSRATWVLDYHREAPDTQGYWLDEHTLLLVTGDPYQGYRWPSQWTGKVQRLDTRTGQRTPEVGLTRMLNSLCAEPMECEPAPSGKWLLWTVTYSADGYPNPVLSTLDGKRHYHWEADKFDVQRWANACQWIRHLRHSDEEVSFTPAPGANNGKLEPSLLPVYVNDVRHPEKHQEIAANSPQAHTLFASLAPDGKEYVLEPQAGSNPPTGWHLAVYDVFDYHIRYDAKPLRTLPLNLPFTPQYGSSTTSPDYQKHRL